MTTTIGMATHIGKNVILSAAKNLRRACTPHLAFEMWVLSLPIILSASLAFETETKRPEADSAPGLFCVCL
jgi:hypothetical protein